MKLHNKKTPSLLERFPKELRREEPLLVCLMSPKKSPDNFCSQFLLWDVREKAFGDDRPPPCPSPTLLPSLMDKMAPNIRRFLTTSSWFWIGISFEDKCDKLGVMYIDLC